MSASFKDMSKKQLDSLYSVVPPPLPKYKVTLLGVIVYINERPNFIVRFMHRFLLGIIWEKV